MCDLSMEVRHLSVLTDEIIVGRVTTNSETGGINHHILTSLWSFKHIQLDVLTHLIDTELTQPHLEHHPLLESYLVSNHQEGSCRGAKILQIELTIVSRDLTVFPRNETLRNHDVI